jgi:hypothetical protein
MENQIKTGETARDDEKPDALMAKLLARLSKESETAKDNILIGLSNAMVNVYDIITRDVM